MTDREVLAAALDEFWKWGSRHISDKASGLIVHTIKERLAQLPETCGTCGGSGKIKKWKIDSGLPPGGVSGYQGREWPETCPSCHGKGYPDETS